MRLWWVLPGFRMHSDSSYRGIQDAMFYDNGSQNNIRRIRIAVSLILSIIILTNTFIFYRYLNNPYQNVY